MKEIKNPIIAKIDKSNGDYEVVIAKKYSDTQEPVYKKFMGMCAQMDAYAVDTKDMNDEETVKACGSLFDQSMGAAIEKVEANLFKMSESGLFDQMDADDPSAKADDPSAKADDPSAKAGLFDQMDAKTKASLFNQMSAGLTKKQKQNLPPELQRAILKKAKAEKKVSASLFNQMDAILKEKASLFNQMDS